MCRVTEPPSDAFADLLAANARFAAGFELAELEGVARAGVGIVTCMDARIDPLAMFDLRPGDAKILRNPGGRVSDEAMTGLVLAVNLLQVDRVLVVEHTRCAMASSTETELRERVALASGSDTSQATFGVIEDQVRQIADDVERIRSHRLVPVSVRVGGFLYDVDTGVLQPIA